MVGILDANRARGQSWCRDARTGGILSGDADHSHGRSAPIFGFCEFLPRAETAEPSNPRPLALRTLFYRILETRLFRVPVWHEATRTARRSDCRPHFTTALIRGDGQNVRVDLGRISWLLTVGACLIAVLILVLQGYLGYAAVTFAVAVSAAINLS